MESDYSQPVNIGNPEEYTILEVSARAFTGALFVHVPGPRALTARARWRWHARSAGPPAARWGCPRGQFAEYIRKSVNPDTKIVHMEAVSDDPRKRKPDITRAAEILQYGGALPLGVRRPRLC